MTGVVVAFVVGALAGLALVLLVGEHWATRSRQIDADIAAFNAKYPRSHLRVVPDEMSTDEWWTR